MLNSRAKRLVNELIEGAQELGVIVHDDGVNVPVVDCGIDCRGSLGAGLALARICMAGLAEVSLAQAGPEMPGPLVRVSSDAPVPACMASQYAGWKIEYESFFAMASGPMRALAGKEELFESIGYRESSPTAVGILETSSLPSPYVCQMIANQCDVDQRDLTLLVAPTTSLAGSVQIVARSLETTLHKLHELQFDLQCVISGFGSAPLPPVRPDFIEAIGVTNDSILYGGDVTLWVDCPDAAIETVIDRVPSSHSYQHGRPFAQLFREVDCDFYKIDPLLFSPAKVRISNVATGKVYEAGRLELNTLEASFS